MAKSTFATGTVDTKVTKESLIEKARYLKTPAGRAETAAWTKNQYDIAPDVLPFEEVLKIAPNAKLLGVDKKNRPVYSGMDNWEAYQIAIKQKNPFIIDEGRGYSAIYTHSPTKGASGKPLTVPQSGSPFMDALEFIGTPVSWTGELAGAQAKALGDVTGIGLLERGGQTIQDIGRDDRVRQLLGALTLAVAGGAGLNAATPAASAAGTAGGMSAPGYAGTLLGQLPDAGMVGGVTGAGATAPYAGTLLSQLPNAGLVGGAAAIGAGGLAPTLAPGLAPFTVNPALVPGAGAGYAGQIAGEIANVAPPTGAAPTTPPTPPVTGQTPPIGTYPSPITTPAAGVVPYAGMPLSEAAAAALAKQQTIQNWLLGSGLALTAAGTIAQIADNGSQDTSATTTTTPTGPGTLPMPGGNTMPGGTGSGGTLPGGTSPAGAPTTFTPGGINTLDSTGKPKSAGALTFEDFINDFYGLNAVTKNVQQRTVEDQAALKGYQQALLDKLSTLDISRLADTKSAVLPYQTQIADILNQSRTGTGYFKPINLSFGGNPVASFVPKQNRALADQLLGIGRESSNINTGLIDMGYTAGRDLAGREFGFNAENLPNKAADTYSAKLEALMKYLNPNTGQTSTTTGSVPGVPWYTTALQGLNTGVNLWDKIYNPRSNTGLTQAQLNALANAGGY